MTSHILTPLIFPPIVLHFHIPFSIFRHPLPFITEELTLENLDDLELDLDKDDLFSEDAVSMTTNVSMATGVSGVTQTSLTTPGGAQYKSSQTPLRRVCITNILSTKKY